MQPKAEELAKHLAELGKLQEKRRRHNAGQLSKMQYQLRSNHEQEKNFNKHDNFTATVQELEKYCTELTKSIDEEKSKMQRQLSKLELSKNIDRQ